MLQKTRACLVLELQCCLWAAMCMPCGMCHCRLPAGMQLLPTWHVSGSTEHSRHTLLSGMLEVGATTERHHAVPILNSECPWLIASAASCVPSSAMQTTADAQSHAPPAFCLLYFECTCQPANNTCVTACCLIN